MEFSNNTSIQTIRIVDRSSLTTKPALNFRTLTLDTQGNSHPALLAEYALYLEERSINEKPAPFLTFRFRAAHPFDALPDSQCGAFTAKLWQRDCSEFFLCNPATGRYLEVNLNPHGAWWAASFNAPRAKRSDEPIENVQCSSASLTDKESDGDGATWSAAISLPLRALETILQSSIVNLTANVTAILATPNQIYLTASHLSGEQPDFHRPTDWLPVGVAGRSC